MGWQDFLRIVQLNASHVVITSVFIPNHGKVINLVVWNYYRAGNFKTEIMGEIHNDWVLAHLKQHPAERIIGFNKMPGLDVYAADVCYAQSRWKGFCIADTSL